MKYVECRDKFSNEVKEGDFVDVQTDGVYQVYKKEDGQLYFKPYGREDRVSDYFSNDMVRCYLIEHNFKNKYCNDGRKD